VQAGGLLLGFAGVVAISLPSVGEGSNALGIGLVLLAALCLLGGMIGILLGRGSSILMKLFLNFPTVLSIPAIVASVGVAVTVGVVFGFYPAWKASRLDPIQALRYE
jgi:ABC-type antimicrobial peptide transport system permease subunit